jgi:hypothetical protein
MRRTSMASGVKLARKRRSAEQFGTCSRVNKAMHASAHGASRSEKASSVRSPLMAYPKRRRATRMRSQMTEMTPCAASMLDKESHVAKPGGRRGNGLRRGLDDHRRTSETGPVCLLLEERFVPSLPWRHMFCPLATHEHPVAQFVGISGPDPCLALHSKIHENLSTTCGM